MKHYRRTMIWIPSHKSILMLFFSLIGFVTESYANLPPYFTEDMNNHVIPENMEIGTPIYTLKGTDPEKGPVKYGLIGTDVLRVDETTGVVTISKPIDREVSDRLKLTITIEDIVPNSGENNLVTIPVTVTISDVNDNPPQVQNPSRFENIQVIEDTKPGVKILPLEIKDPDLTGMTLNVKCVPSQQSPEACSIFHVKVHEATAGYLKGDLVLGEPLDFNKRSLYQFQLIASDGEHKSTVQVLIRIKDVQNTPPIFTGALAGRVMEDAQVGTLVMLIQARDGDLGKPRDVKLTLLTNPGEVFQLDSKSGRLTTTRPLDREVLGSLLKLEVKATEIMKQKEGESDVFETVKNVTVLIDDVNDSEPKFNRKHYFTELSENTEIGTPLGDLDMSITDLDTGTFADFTLRIDGPLSDLFDIQPKFASGSVKPVIRAKKRFDYENPNERKFIILVIAQNTDEPELFSTAAVSVSIMDENDNRPKFDRDFYQLRIPESVPEGTRIGEITAEDPDSGEFGNEGLVYQLIGSGSKRFLVNNRTGEIFIASCNPEISACLDYETQKTYDLLYMASDMNKMDAYLKSVVPVQIVLTDSNDNPVHFLEVEHSRTIPENTRHFEPPFFILGEDKDASALITYKLFNDGNSQKYFQIDENTGEVLIKNKKELPPGNYTFKVEASDGLHTALAPVFIQVVDINNHYPTFTQKTLESRIFNVEEDVKVGTIITSVLATDSDLSENGVVRYSIEKGSFDYFEIDPVKGDITLTKDLDYNEISNFELLVTAYDQGSPSLRTLTTIQINVINKYIKLPQIPKMQRIQVSESAEVGDLVTVIETLPKVSEVLEDLHFDFVSPIEARNQDNQQVDSTTKELARDWFSIDSKGRVEVIQKLQRELVTAMNLTVMITSEYAKPGSKSLGSLMITIFEVNDKPPIVEDIEIEILEELPPGQAILTLEAEDPEGGQISHYYIEKGKEYFKIDNKTGEIKVNGRLDYERQPVYNITVVAVDSGVPQLSSTATIMVSLVNDNDNDPSFDKAEYETEIYEHPEPGSIVTRVTATDLDIDSSLTYEIIPFTESFEINRLGEILVTPKGSELIDRDTMKDNPYLTIHIKASDGERFGYTSVRIHILDRNDNSPKFLQEKYQVTVHAPLRAKQEILRVTGIGGDLPETDRMQYHIIEDDSEGIFEIDNESGTIKASQGFEKYGDFNLIVEVKDGGSESDTAKVHIQVLPGNFRKPEFLFPNKINSTLVTKESDLKETERYSKDGSHTKVLGQLLAYDGDEGNAGKISFFFKDGDNLVSQLDKFRIESESGRIHQIKPLDREEMNKHDLLVVAKDHGSPVSSETQHILTIQVMDIDDHKPHFIQRQYTFSIKENLDENTNIGQVQAEDEDEGNNAQIFYFLVTDKESKHLKDDVKIDIKSGMIYTTKGLDRERIEHYKLYVRALASPIINRTLELITSESDFLDDYSLASVNITILDENDNPPQFKEKQYYAAINSEAEPGREIITLKAHDPDTSSTSPVQYSILSSNLIVDDGSFRSGGSVIPSPFVIDGNTGRLSLSQSGMRQYAGGNNRFQVKIKVYETVPQFQSDTAFVSVFIVESIQESILTVKSPPTSLVKEGLIKVLSNITSSHVLITKIVPHVRDDGSVNKEWSDIYVTAIDKKNHQTIGVPHFLQALDLGHDYLKNQDMPIILHSAVPVIPVIEAESAKNGTFDTAFAGLVALIALLCMGIAAIIGCCCCINRLYEKDNDSEKQTIYGPMKFPSHTSIPGTPSIVGIRHPNGDMIEDVATDNPLWIDHKIKSYEEQELTMQVADNSNNGSIDIDEDQDQDREEQEGHNKPHFSHAYATLHHHPTIQEDYDILGEDTIAVHL